MISRTHLSLLLATGFGLLLVSSARAQWTQQDFTLKPGWNAVYFHVDASYASLDEIVGTDSANPIVEIWKWQPAISTEQFVTSPAEPTTGNSLWASWVRSEAVADSFTTLSANTAYLVHNSSASDYTWSVVGRNVVIRQEWTTTGLNLIGFPVPVNDPPLFSTFLAPSSALSGGEAEFYHYPGGDLGSGNPARLYTLLTTDTSRGQAYWVRANGDYNRYFGPFEVTLQSGNEVEFNDTAGQYRIRLRNLTSDERTVELYYLAGVDAPDGVAETSVGTPPLLLRGELNTTDLTYSYETMKVRISIPVSSWTLQPEGEPGSEVEIVIGLDRTKMTAPAGSLYGGNLSFRDTERLQVTAASVTATVPERGGLWVGAAAVTQVQHYLKQYEVDGAGNLTTETTANGESYVVQSIDTSLGGTTRAFPLRLIVHAETGGANAKLLQRVYHGLDTSTNAVVALNQTLLDANQLSSARRISAAHLPWSSANAAWSCTGTLGSSLNVTVPLSYDDHGSNPFLHTYHPDHDNRATDFTTTLAQGAESYGVQRQINLAFTAPGDDFDSLTRSGATLSGNYTETVTLQGTGAFQRSFQVSGSFSLFRVSDIATLTTE